MSNSNSHILSYTYPENQSSLANPKNSSKKVSRRFLKTKFLWPWRISSIATLFLGCINVSKVSSIIATRLKKFSTFLNRAQVDHCASTHFWSTFRDPFCINFYHVQIDRIQLTWNIWYDAFIERLSASNICFSSNRLIDKIIY